MPCFLPKPLLPPSPVLAQALRLRLTKLVLADCRLVGITALGAGTLGVSETDRRLALEPLRAVFCLVRVTRRDTDRGEGGAKGEARDLGTWPPTWKCAHLTLSPFCL
jgi:hypothetical protein